MSNDVIEQDVSLQAMVETIEYEIVSMKRLYGPRSDLLDTHSGRRMRNLKGAASFLREQIAARRSGPPISKVDWKFVDPGREIPAGVLPPVFLSILVKIPSGGYRTETTFFELGDDRSRIGGSVYAYAELPQPAPLEEFPDELR